jgi:DNA-3-methyladenine glycosylase I
MANSYCEAITTIKEEQRELHQHYHDLQYGFPLSDDDELFGRLILEINQAGLSWTTILNKQANFRHAYANFNIKKVAAFTEQDRERLLADAGIIRNKLKVNAAIENAKRILTLQKHYGSFKAWLDSQGQLSREQWTKLFKQTFVFTGGEIVNEFLLSTGYLPGAHIATCPIYKEVLKQKPAWTNQSN